MIDGKILTFVPNKTLPIYNWFYYKEGYSRNFMEYAYEKLNVLESESVLDPFLGSGTTCLYAKERGNVCYGRDVNDVALIAAKAKTYDYDVDKLKKCLSEIYVNYRSLKNKSYDTSYPSIVLKAFPKPVLQDILRFKESISRIEEEKYRTFFITALMNTSTICTYAEKHGGSIRINKSRSFPPVKIKFKQIAKKMISDVLRIKFKGIEKDIDIRKEDARFLKSIDDDSIDILITSPPYLNKIEYTNVYAIEQYLFLSKQYSKPAVRSFIGENITNEIEDIFEGKYPLNNISKAYFKDMQRVIKVLANKLSDKGRGAIVIGQGCFPNGVVKSDELLKEIMKKEGLKVFDIEKGNKRWCMRDRVKKVGIMEENIIWFSV